MTPVTVTYYSYSDTFLPQRESSYTRKCRIELDLAYSDTYGVSKCVTLSGQHCNTACTRQGTFLMGFRQKIIGKHSESVHVRLDVMESCNTNLVCACN